MCATNRGSGLQPRHLPWSRTGNPLVHRPALNPLSQTSQGPVFDKLQNLGRFLKNFKTVLLQNKTKCAYILCFHVDARKTSEF